MKREARTFIKRIKELEFPESEKSELATKLMYLASTGTLKKSDSRIGMSALADIVGSNSDIKAAYDEIDGSYLSKKDLKELNQTCIEKFRSGPCINRELYDLVCRLLKIKNSDLVLHLNAQDEGFLMEASNITNKGSLKLNTYAIPDNDHAGELIKMRLFLNDTPYTYVDDEEKLKRFKPNKIFMNPSYSTIDKDYRFSLKDKDSFWEILLRASDGMPKNAKVVALVPNAMLSNSLDMAKKEQLLRKGFLEGIVSIPVRYYSTGLTTEASLLVISRGNPKVKVVDINKVMSTAEVRNADQGSITDYIEYCYQSNYNEVEIEDLLKKDSNLLISNIVTSDIYSGLGNLETLSKIADIKQGTKKTLIDFGDNVDQSGESVYCLLSSNDIIDGQINYDGLTKVMHDSKLAKMVLAQEGDVLITNKSSRPKMAVVERNDIRLIPIGSMIVISPHPDELNGTYLKMFFESDAGAAILSTAKRGQKTNTINPADVKKLMVPCVDIPIQEQIVEQYVRKNSELAAAKAEVVRIQNEIKNLVNKGEK